MSKLLLTAACGKISVQITHHSGFVKNISDYVTMAYLFLLKHDIVNYLDELNEPQREAVTATDGPSLVIAGAGSGKTRVLTYRIAHLLKSGIQPGKILALTFTNKAAREMKDRISAIVGQNTAKYLWMGTFHSVFARILRVESANTGYPSDFTIYDSADSKSLLRAIIKDLQFDEKVYKPNVVAGRVSAAKNGLITPAAYQQNSQIIEYDMSIRMHVLQKFTRNMNADVFWPVLWILMIYCSKQIFSFATIKKYSTNTSVTSIIFW